MDGLQTSAEITLKGNADKSISVMFDQLFNASTSATPSTFTLKVSPESEATGTRYIQFEVRVMDHTTGPISPSGKIPFSLKVKSTDGYGTTVGQN